MFCAGEMQRMLVLCFGIQKSGSTLAFELVRGVLETAGFAQPFLRNDRFKNGAAPEGARNFVEHITGAMIEELAQEIGPDRRIAVKTHSGFPAGIFPWLEDLQARRELQVIGRDGSRPARSRSWRRSMMQPPMCARASRAIADGWRCTGHWRSTSTPWPMRLTTQSPRSKGPSASPAIARG
jgi:hypothetical protein